MIRPLPRSHLRLRRARLAIGVASVIGLAACAAPQPVVTLQHDPRVPYGAEDYRTVLARWTRSRVITVLRELGTTLRVHATLRSAEFDAAYVTRWSALFRLPPAARAELARELATQRAGGFGFVVVAATHDRDWNDFDRPRSQWRLALLNDRGEQVDARRIQREPRPSTTDRAMFPQLGAFYRLYRVEFPSALPDGRPLVRAETRELLLSVAGPLGRAELRWRLR